MRIPYALVVALPLLAATPLAAQRAAPPILRAGGQTVRVRLVDGSSARPLANAAVEIWSDNGIRCFRAPCPTNGTRWQGHADAAGVVVIPRAVLQASTSITTPGYEGDLVQDARQQRDNTWKMPMKRTGAAGQGQGRM